MTRTRPYLALLGMLIWALAPPTRAQDVPPPVTDTTQKTADDAKKAADDKKDKKDPKKGGQIQIDTTGGFGTVDPNAHTNAEKLLGRWARGLNFSGGWTLTARSNGVTGSQQAREWFAFENNNAFFNRQSLGPFQQNLNLSLTGKLFNTVEVNGTLTNNRINASLAQLMKLRYDTKRGTIVDLGDVPANLSGNDLVPFTRNVQGLRFERDMGGGRKVTTLASVTRALTRRNSFQGNGSTGPYYLGGSQIVQGTEHVFLNGQELAYGEDYEIDYQLGILRFLKSRIINRSDTVEYTYEMMSYNSSSGVLTGMRWELPTGQGGLTGVTMLRQISSGNGNRNGAINQYFPVDANLQVRYTLASPIKPGTPIVVHYQERLLVEGVAADYLVNRELNYIQLRRPLPPDTALTGLTSLKVTYTPVAQQGIGGNKDVVGLDTQLRLGDNSRIKIQMAQSKALTPDGTGGGMDITARFSSPAKQKRNAWTARTTLRSIGTGFSSIDSTAGAFLRAERGINTAFTFTPSELWDMGLGLTRSRFANVSYLAGSTATSSTAPTGYTDNQKLDLALNLNLPSRRGRPMPKIKLSHTDTNQNLVSGTTGDTTTTTSNDGSRSRFQSDTLGLDWNLGKLTLGASLDQKHSTGRTVFGVGYTGGVSGGLGGVGGGVLGDIRDGSANASVTNGSSTSLSLNAAWTANARLSLTGTVGVSHYRNGSLSSSNSSSNNSSDFNANDTNFGVIYWLIPERLQTNLTLSDSRNGQSLSGFYGTGGVGSGSNNGLGLSTGQRTKSRIGQLSYTPNDVVRVDVSRSEQLALVPNYDNTASTSNDLTVAWSPKPQLTMSGTVSNQVGRYVGGQGDYNNTNYSFNVAAGSPTGLQTRASLARMNFGSTSFYSGGTGGLGTGYGGGLGSGAGGFGTSLVQGGRNDTIVVRFDYPLRSLVPFVELNDLNATNPNASSGGTSGTPGLPNGSQYHSSTNYRRRELRLGIDWRFTAVLGATLDLRLIKLTDRDDSHYSYRAHTVNFDLSARF